MVRRKVKQPYKRTKPFKSNLPKDANGKIINPGGRPKGLPNKITSEAKTAIALAFEGMGGLAKFIEWGKKNPNLFYTMIYTKLIPLQVQGKLDLKTDDNGQAVAALERIILGIRAARLTGDGGGEAPRIIDATAVRESTPRLVVSSSTGAETSEDNGGDE